MTRYLNQGYIAPLSTVLPPSRLGMRGDGPKAGCATCHNGLHKPLAGAQMAKDYPALWGHGGTWQEPLPSDTAGVGIMDLRGSDRIPSDSQGPLTRRTTMQRHDRVGRRAGRAAVVRPARLCAEAASGR